MTSALRQVDNQLGQSILEVLSQPVPVDEARCAAAAEVAGLEVVCWQVLGCNRLRRACVGAR